MNLLFEAEGLQKVKELLDDQKNRARKIAGTIKGPYEEEKSHLAQAKISHKTQLEASKLGIHSVT